MKVQQLSQLPYRTLDPNHPLPPALEELFAEAPDELISEVLSMLGESPEALRGTMIGFNVAMTLIKAGLDEYRSLPDIGITLTALMYGLERSPEYAAAVAVLEGDPWK